MKTDRREYYAARGRRKQEARAMTLSAKLVTQRERVHLRLVSSAQHERPATRGECLAMDRPCPYVGCKWHLYLDVTPRGGLTLNFPHLEPHELAETCALDVADLGGSTLEDVGELMNLTGERVRQVEKAAREKLEGIAQHATELEFSPSPHFHMADNSPGDGNSMNSAE